jgi:hypothetical protein
MLAIFVANIILSLQMFSQLTFLDEAYLLEMHIIYVGTYVKG